MGGLLRGAVGGMLAVGKRPFPTSRPCLQIWRGWSTVDAPDAKDCAHELQQAVRPYGIAVGPACAIAHGGHANGAGASSLGGLGLLGERAALWRTKPPPIRRFRQGAFQGARTVLLKSGQWLGRGSLLVEGASLGQAVECDVLVEQDSGGLTLTGEVGFKAAQAMPLSIRVAPDEVGTYVVDARLGELGLDGVAKLESAPNLGLLWNRKDSLHVAFTLFELRSGYGFRGFLREQGRTLTWEVAFSLRQDAIEADNVVTLRPRR